MNLNRQISTFSLTAVTIAAGLLFSACQSQTAPSASSSSSSVTKTGDTTKTGKVIQTNNKFFLQSGGKLQEIDSYSIKLADYIGKNVSATGQFSGDTLFVAKIQAQ